MRGEASLDSRRADRHTGAMGEPRQLLDPVGRILIAAGILAVVLLLISDIAAASAQAGWSINGQTLWGRDFANLWSAGQLWLQGKTAILYDVEAYQAWQRGALGPGIDNHNYSYPPVSLFYAPLFGAMPYLVALASFLALSVAAFWWAARDWMKAFGLPSWWSLALPATLLCLWAGHYGLILAALWCVAWRWQDEKPVRAGIAAGLMLIKPHLAILLPLLMARRGAWKAFAVAAMTVVVLVGLSALAFGTDLWRTYLSSTSGLQLALVGEANTMFGLMMPTWATTLVAWGLPVTAALVVQGAIALVTVGLLLWKLPADPLRAGALGAVATFLVLPYGFNYDMPAVGLAALLYLAYVSWLGLRLEALVAGLALALPPAMIWLGAMHVRVAPVIITLLFALMWRRYAWLADSTLGRRSLAVPLGA